MPEWLIALSTLTEPSVLVTVAAAQGSVPREAGTKMLVTRNARFDTIGGGHLEWTACTIAGEMLASASQGDAPRNRIERLPLGPTLGQCCGGVVWLAFELVDAGASQFSLLKKRLEERHESWRLVPLDGALSSSLFDRAGGWLAGPMCQLPTDASIDEQSRCQLVQGTDGTQWMLDPCVPHRPQLFLFGAGHVGAAIVRLLGTLSCQVVWVDEREDLFPADLPVNVSMEATDIPETVINKAPPGASFLVMTHSHALDQHLAEVILNKQDAGWFGLIGSRTKRIQFERRLRARGVSEQRLATMVCPIGIGGIEGKEPATIAVAVVAQLLQVWEKQARHGHALPVTNKDRSERRAEIR